MNAYIIRLRRRILGRRAQVYRQCPRAMSTEKISTLILEVDLQCEKCYRKIQKVLCKLQPKENIRKIDYDNKKNTVTISGPFDPQKLSKKLRCKACDAIKDIKIFKPEEKKPEAKKPEEKKPEEKKPEEKKPEVKKPEEKKPDDKKKPEEKKPEEKKPEDKKEKPKVDEAKPTAAAPPPWSSTTMVNLQFTNTCGICFPWPCSDPTHCGGVVQPQQPQQPPQPQWPPPCEGMVPQPSHAPGHHQHPPPWGKWSPCGGPSYCGGCVSCHGMHGWPVVPPPPQPMCCPGPSACRGCNGCRIVHESKFSYEEYPPNACAIM